MIKDAKNMVLTALLLGLVLATVFHFAAPTITHNQQQYELSLLAEVVGNPELNITPAPERDDYFILSQQDVPVGQLQQLSTFEGYNGEITFWLATRAKTNSSEIEILGVRVIRHQETPGLGDKLELAISDWILSFNGQTLSSKTWDVKKYGGDFDQFSGATITPRAVVHRVASHLETLEASQ